MKSTVTWRSDVIFDAVTDSGHTITMDGPPDHGGLNTGARPMEVLLTGVGGCASFDVVTILKRSRQAVTAARCELSATRADNVPAVFTQIHLHFVVSGDNMSEKQVARACELSATKYCSATKMLGDGGVEISHTYEIEAPQS